MSKSVNNPPWIHTAGFQGYAVFLWSTIYRMHIFYNIMQFVSVFSNQYKDWNEEKNELESKMSSFTIVLRT